MIEVIDWFQDERGRRRLEKQKRGREKKGTGNNFPDYLLTTMGEKENTSVTRKAIKFGS